MDEFKRIDNLNKDILIINRQIKQLEGEYDFLINEFQRASEDDLAKILNKLAKDPKVERLMGKAFVENAKQAVKDSENSVPVDKKDCSLFFNKMNRELKVLHERQVGNYKKLKRELEDREVSEEYQGESFLQEAEELILAYSSMIKTLDSQYGALDVLIKVLEKKKKRQIDEDINDN